MKETDDRSTLRRLWRAYRLRQKRRYFLARAIRRRRNLISVADRTETIAKGDILLFMAVKDELERIPHFLDYYRSLGVSHFLVVDNNSSDGTADNLAEHADVSLWHTDADYKLSRFGVDWTTWLQFRFGHGHWCLTLDADELLLTPYSEKAGLKDLVDWLDENDIRSMGATMVDLYPKGRLGDAQFSPGQNPLSVLNWFDAGNFHTVPRREVRSGVTRGGVRLREFFSDEPQKAPTMNKVPLVKWNRRFAYLTSTHVILPPFLNEVSGASVKRAPQAAILHTKFLPSSVQKASDSAYRAAHFENSAAYTDYYESLASNPQFLNEDSVRFQGWEQLEELGLLARGDWSPQ